MIWMLLSESSQEHHNEEVSWDLRSKLGVMIGFQKRLTLGGWTSRSVNLMFNGFAK